MSKQEFYNLFLQTFESEFPIRGQVDLPSTAATTSKEGTMTSTATKTPSNTEKADEFKVRGNNCVKSEQYQKAIHYYTEAIRLNKFEPIYFSNRALCYLKLKRFAECIEDSTIAIGLDENCVKAYYRRMSAREELNENLDAALNDCQKILTIDQKNGDAKKALVRLQNKGNVKSVSTASVNKNVELTNGIQPNKSNEVVAPKAEENVLWSQFQNLSNYEPIDFVTKPPHLRSKESLKRLKITEISSNKIKLEHPSTSKRDEKVEEEQKKIKIDVKNEVEKINEEINEVKKVDGTKEEVKEFEEEAKKNVVVEPKLQELVIPKTTAQFHKSWLSTRTAEQKYVLLKGIYNLNIATLFGSQFEELMLSEILTILKQYFVPNNQPILNIMDGIVNIREMSIIALFMGDEDKLSFTKLIAYMRTNGENNALIDKIEKKFENLLH